MTRESNHGYVEHMHSAIGIGPDRKLTESSLTVCAGTDGSYSISGSDGTVSGLHGSVPENGSPF
jgi:hypothetical protein